MVRTTITSFVFLTCFFMTFESRSSYGTIVMSSTENNTTTTTTTTITTTTTNSMDHHSYNNGNNNDNTNIERYTNTIHQLQHYGGESGIQQEQQQHQETQSTGIPFLEREIPLPPLISVERYHHNMILNIQTKPTVNANETEIHDVPLQIHYTKYHDSTIQFWNPTTNTYETTLQIQRKCSQQTQQRQQQQSKQSTTNCNDNITSTTSSRRDMQHKEWTVQEIMKQLQTITIVQPSQEQEYTKYHQNVSSVRGTLPRQKNNNKILIEYNNSKWEVHETQQPKTPTSLDDEYEYDDDDGLIYIWHGDALLRTTTTTTNNNSTTRTRRKRPILSSRTTTATTTNQMKNFGSGTFTFRTRTIRSTTTTTTTTATPPSPILHLELQYGTFTTLQSSYTIQKRFLKLQQQTTTTVHLNKTVLNTEQHDDHSFTSTTNQQYYYDIMEIPWKNLPKDIHHHSNMENDNLEETKKVVTINVATTTVSIPSILDDTNHRHLHHHSLNYIGNHNNNGINNNNNDILLDPIIHGSQNSGTNMVQPFHDWIVSTYYNNDNDDNTHSRQQQQPKLKRKRTLQFNEETTTTTTQQSLIEIDVLLILTNRAACEMVGLKYNCTLTNVHTRLIHDTLLTQEGITNQIFQNSFTNVQINFLLSNDHILYLAPNHDDLYTNPISQPADLALKTIENSKTLQLKRNETGADFMALITTSRITSEANAIAAACGIARQGSYVSATDYKCFSSYSLVHQLGHNFDLYHNRVNSTILHAYAHGYQSISTTATSSTASALTSFRTIMAEDCVPYSCPRIPYFSSTEVTYNGRSIGNFLNQNVKRIRENAPLIQTYRTYTPPSPNPTTSPTQIQDTLSCIVNEEDDTDNDNPVQDTGSPGACGLFTCSFPKWNLGFFLVQTCRIQNRMYKVHMFGYICSQRCIPENQYTKKRQQGWECGTCSSRINLF